MGTIVIEEYGAAGGSRQHDTPIANLYTLLARTEDATTTTSEESLTLQKDTSYVVLYGVEDHRVANKAASDTDDSGLYSTIRAGVTRDLGVKGGSVFYYRTDA